MHPLGPELPISAHVACARVCRQLYVLRASHALVQATVGVGTVIVVYIGVAYTRGGGGYCVILGTTRILTQSNSDNALKKTIFPTKNAGLLSKSAVFAPVEVAPPVVVEFQGGRGNARLLLGAAQKRPPN